MKKWIFFLATLTVGSLPAAGFAAVVITNQAAVGRGIIDEPFLAEVHAALDAEEEEMLREVLARLHHERQVVGARRLPAPDGVDERGRAAEAEPARRRLPDGQVSIGGGHGRPHPRTARGEIHQ